MMRLLPQNLAGQIALVMTIALLAASTVSFGLLAAERARAGLIEATGPAVARFVDLAQDIAADPPARASAFGRGGGRISLTPRSAIDTRGLSRNERLEDRLKVALRDAELQVAGLKASTNVVVRPARFGPGERRPGPRSADNAPQTQNRTIRGREIVLSIVIADGRWLNATFFSPEPPRGDFVRLIAFTFIAFVCVLGAALWVASRLARPLRDLAASAAQVGEAGEPQEVLVRGSSDIRQTLEAFNAMSRRVTQLLNEKDVMLGALGHDLRTPLASLRIRVDSMEPEAERNKAIQTINEATQLLEDILVLARQGRSGEKEVVADVSMIVQDLVEDYAETGANVDLGAAVRAPARCRPVLFRRLLRNLIDNALVYGEHADVHVAIRDGFVTVSIEDDGPGLSDEMMRDALQPFVRGEASRNRASGGAGLGLAIADAIARAHGGALHLANRAQGGLSASVLLPLATPAAPS